MNFNFQESALQTIKKNITFVPNVERALFIDRRCRADFVFNTAKLEGNPFTFPEVKTLLEGITVGGHKQSDANQVLNINRGLDLAHQWVKEKRFVLNADSACQLQGLVAEGEALTWGKFRDDKVTIAGTEYVPPAAKDLPIIFNRGVKLLMAQKDEIFRAFLTFLWGSINQFFYDGNKRTARILANATLMSAGYPPLLILAKDQLTYNQLMIHFYDTQDATEMLIWLYSSYQKRVEEWGGFGVMGEHRCISPTD